MRLLYLLYARRRHKITTPGRRRRGDAHGLDRDARAAPAGDAGTGLVLPVDCTPPCRPPAPCRSARRTRRRRTSPSTTRRRTATTRRGRALPRRAAPGPRAGRRARTADVARLCEIQAEVLGAAVAASAPARRSLAAGRTATCGRPIWKTCSAARSRRTPATAATRSRRRSGCISTSRSSTPSPTATRAARLGLEYVLRRARLPTPALAPLVMLPKPPGDAAGYERCVRVVAQGIVRVGSGGGRRVVSRRHHLVVEGHPRGAGRVPAEGTHHPAGGAVQGPGAESRGRQNVGEMTRQVHELLLATPGAGITDRRVFACMCPSRILTARIRRRRPG